ncbi:MAG: hypothetical protein LKI24_13950 [Acidipropionibacterium sp.]|nr:hypothetical protein [Acidipropionibacterium sp.]
MRGARSLRPSRRLAATRTAQHRIELEFDPQHLDDGVAKHLGVRVRGGHAERARVAEPDRDLPAVDLQHLGVLRQHHPEHLAVVLDDIEHPRPLAAQHRDIDRRNAGCRGGRRPRSPCGTPVVPGPGRRTSRRLWGRRSGGGLRGP